MLRSFKYLIMFSDNKDIIPSQEFSFSILKNFQKFKNVYGSLLHIILHNAGMEPLCTWYKNLDNQWHRERVYWNLKLFYENMYMNWFRLHNLNYHTVLNEISFDIIVNECKLNRKVCYIILNNIENADLKINYDLMNSNHCASLYF